MQVYGKEIEELNKVVKDKESLIVEVNAQLKEKEVMIDAMTKQNRLSEKEKDQHRV